MFRGKRPGNASMTKQQRSQTCRVSLGCVGARQALAERSWEDTIVVDRILEEKICSFCGEPGSASRRLAGGLGAMICFECLESYYKHSRSKERVSNATRPVWEGMTDAELLATLPLILKAAQQNAEFANEWVDLI